MKNKINQFYLFVPDLPTGYKPFFMWTYKDDNILRHMIWLKRFSGNTTICKKSYETTPYNKQSTRTL